MIGSGHCYWTCESGNERGGGDQVQTKKIVQTWKMRVENAEREVGSCSDLTV